LCGALSERAVTESLKAKAPGRSFLSVCVVRLASVRTMFAIYTLFIAAGLVMAITIGILNR
jgi:hypothetical protein